MSSDLSLARQLLKASANSAGRKIDHQFRDLRQAVQHVIAHLEKAEKATKKATGATPRSSLEPSPPAE